MRRYYITDRKRYEGDILDAIEAAAADGVDWIQIREKDLPPRELVELTRAALARVAGYSAKLLVNSRLDVALAAGADGVHLTSNAPPPNRLRTLPGPRFLIGVSTHSLEEAERAAAEGADFAVFGPVFPTDSKPGETVVAGIDSLAEVCAWARLPVLALGGVSVENAQRCLDAGSAGVAGISMFQNA